MKLREKLLKTISKMANHNFLDAAPKDIIPIPEIEALEHSKRTLKNALKLTGKSYEQVHSCLDKIAQFQEDNKEANTASENANQISKDACILRIKANDLTIAIAHAHNLKGFIKSTITDNINAKNELGKIEERIGAKVTYEYTPHTNEAKQKEYSSHMSMEVT